MKTSRLHIATFRRMPLLVICFAALAWGRELTVTGQVDLLEQRGKSKSPDNSGVVVWLAPLAAPRAEAGTRLDSSRREALRIIQKGKQFLPHMLVVPVGAEVEFPNLDPFFHTVFSLFEGQRFDLGLYEAGSTRTVKFSRPGVCYIFCNIHPEMGAAVIVLDTPYSGISDRAGQIRIPAVPPGRYRMGVWSERSSPDELKAFGRVVTIGENSTSLGRIPVKVGNPFILHHLNKYGLAYDTTSSSNPLYGQP